MGVGSLSTERNFQSWPSPPSNVSECVCLPPPVFFGRRPPETGPGRALPLRSASPTAGGSRSRTAPGAAGPRGTSLGVTRWRAGFVVLRRHSTPGDRPGQRRRRHQHAQLHHAPIRPTRAPRRPASSPVSSVRSCRAALRPASVWAQSDSKASTIAFTTLGSLVATPILAPGVELQPPQAHAAHEGLPAVAHDRAGCAGAAPGTSAR